MLFHALCLAFVGSCWGDVLGGAVAAPSLQELRQARWPQASMAAEVSPRAIPPFVVQQLLGQVQALRASQRAVCAAAKKGCGKQNIDIFTAIFAAGAGNKMPELLHELPFDVGPFLEWAREEGSSVYALKVRVVQGLNSAEGAVDLQATRPLYAVEPQLSHSISNLLYFVNAAFEKGWKPKELQEWSNPHSVAEVVLQSPFASTKEEASAATHEGRLEVLKHAVDPTVGTDEKKAMQNMLLESKEIEAKLGVHTNVKDRSRNAAEQVAQMALEAAPADAGMGVKFNGCHFSGLRNSQGTQDRISLVLEQWVLPPSVVEHFPSLLLYSRGRVYTKSKPALEAFGGHDFVMCVHDPSKVRQLRRILDDIEAAGERLRYIERIELCAVAFGLKHSSVSHRAFLDCRDRGSSVEVCSAPPAPPQCKAGEEHQQEDTSDEGHDDDASVLLPDAAPDDGLEITDG